MNPVDNLLSSYSDLYLDPRQGKLGELESDLIGLDFSGIHIGAPDSVDASVPGIPILALEGNTMLRSWEVDPRKNCVVIATSLDYGITRIWPLYKPPTKRMAPTPEAAKPQGESAEARSFSARHLLAGEAVPGGLPSGEYSLCLLEWDRASNIRVVKRLTGPGGKPALPRTPAWNYTVFAATPEAFRPKGGSPTLKEPEGAVLVLSGESGKAALLGTFSVKARSIHLDPPDPKHMAVMGIGAVVPVDIVLLSKGKLVSEHRTLQIPIYGPLGAKSGDSLKGWFEIPLAGLQRKEETMVYAFVDGFRAGPVRIPALKP